jgi:hypothetical protein
MRVGVDQASEIVSRIEVKVRVEKSTPKKLFIPKKRGKKTPNQRPFSDSIKKESGHEMFMDCYSGDTVDGPMARERTPHQDQGLMFRGRQLEEGRTRSEYTIRNGSSPRLNESPIEATSGPGPVYGTAPGARGVICFGERTDQQLDPYYGFEEDTNFKIEPFVIEMRMRSKFNF